MISSPAEAELLAVLVTVALPPLLPATIFNLQQASGQVDSPSVKSEKILPGSLLLSTKEGEWIRSLKEKN